MMTKSAEAYAAMLVSNLKPETTQSDKNRMALAFQKQSEYWYRVARHDHDYPELYASHFQNPWKHAELNSAVARALMGV